MVLKEWLSDYIWKLIEEKKRPKQKLHSIKKRGWTTGNPKTLRRSRQKTSRKRQQKSHRKTDRNSSKPRWPRSQQTLHNNTKQLCGKIFSGNTKVKDENGITSCIRKIKSRDGRNISVQYSMEKILKTQQILKWNNQQN